jgi:Flp pilus assembly protein TadG
MSTYNVLYRTRKREQGQTIVLMALTVVTMLAMAALAIDVVTLYVARSEMQRAADAAALAGARAFVDSGVTSEPGNATLQTLAQNMATAMINSTVQQNKIGGVQPALAGAPAFDFTRPGNPQLSVTLQRTDLPMFFARIWGSRPMTVTASAVAEAYNSSSSQTSTGNYVPIQPKCVKPLLVINKDPNRAGAAFVTNGTGLAASGVIGEELQLTPACTKGGPSTCSAANLPANFNQPGNFLPADVTTSPNPNNSCPSCRGASDYEQSIECCDFNVYSCGGLVANAKVDDNIGRGQLRNRTTNGVQCLINDPSHDTIDVSDLITDTGPAKIISGNGPQLGNLVTTSNSIATLPIIDPPAPMVGNQVIVIGFLQLFIEETGTTGPGSFHGRILNVIGCGNSPSGTTVASGSSTAIPVRLIHP